MRTLEHGIWNRLSHLALDATVRGAALALDLPPLRDFLLDKLLQRLERSYDELETDPQRLLHER
jgi:hypothetical protein